MEYLKINNYNPKYKENIFINRNYLHYVIQYEGEISNIKEISGTHITVINESFAILSVEQSNIEYTFDATEIVNKINESEVSNKFYIVYLEPLTLFSLQQISAIEAVGVNLLQDQMQLNLTGKGVVVGIIDTGIDYLNEEFMDSEGNTRINLIWDQTIDSIKEENREIPFGEVYTKDDINRVIQAKRNGENPYSIVPSRDMNGHGTSMAGIVGAAGKKPDIKGIAPECEFVVIKLVESIAFKYRNGYDESVTVFDASVIFAAIEFLNQYLLRQQKPVVILLPLGSNAGSHKGINLLDSYIESITRNIGIAVVSGTGNEGIEDEHVSGIIQEVSGEEVVDLIMDENQKDCFVEVWVDLPNIMEVGLISPSGEATGIIQLSFNLQEKYEFTIENTKVMINYFVPEKYSGDEFIMINFSNITPGIWSIVLKLKLGSNARYNMWTMQRELLEKGTRFSPSDPYGTITIPGDSSFVITVAAYNQNNNNLLGYSGTAFRDDKDDKIDFAAGGVNTLTVGLNNTTRIINGTSLAAAIGAGACVLLFQWGIVNGNYPYMYTQSMKTFFRRGTERRRGDKYPNSHLGYGIINFYKIFNNMT